MRYEFISKTRSKRLLLIFAGWGMDSRPFAGVSRPDCDVAVAFDYSDGLTEAEVACGYEEIMIVAWSFGVTAANHFMHQHPQLPVTRRIAINGTLHPSDEKYGIPPAIFNATLNGLSEHSLHKFRRRMCGGEAATARWIENAPDRSIASLAGELTAIPGLVTEPSHWDKAYISSNDRIIPPDNQLAEWKRHGVVTIETPGPHLPDFNSIIASEIIDKRLVGQRFAHASGTYDKHAGVQAEIAAELSALWHKHAPLHTGNVLEIGAGTGVFTRSYTQWLAPVRLDLWDLASVCDTLPGVHTICDAESSIMHLADGSLDAIASASTIQWFSSPSTFARRCAEKLRSGGLLVISTFGPRNYHELQRSDYLSVADWQRILSGNFDQLECKEQEISINFQSSTELLRHIKLTGVNAVSSGPKAVRSAKAIIDSGLKTLTYHPILFIARKK